MSNKLDAGHTTTDAQLKALWDDFKGKEAAWAAEGMPAKAASERAMWKAEERFIEASTTSLTGIKLKLEYAMATNCFAYEGTRRLVSGLIRDLKAELRVR